MTPKVFSDLVVMMLLSSTLATQLGLDLVLTGQLGPLSKELLVCDGDDDATDGQKKKAYADLEIIKTCCNNN